jgi:hypothetical protein
VLGHTFFLRHRRLKLDAEAASVHLPRSAVFWTIKVTAHGGLGLLEDVKLVFEPCFKKKKKIGV